MAYALMSLTDKSGSVEFARGLESLGFKILSTGGTAKQLRAAGLEVLDVSEFTGQAEILDGRVKTLHPKIHGGILADWANPEHQSICDQQGIEPIRIICVNLYPFAEEAVAKALGQAEAIEYIDIGGPTMIRSAAKNYKHNYVVVDPADYGRVLEALKAEERGSGAEKSKFAESLRAELARKAFALTAHYDALIVEYLSHLVESQSDLQGPQKYVALDQARPLRYGENPQQKAAWYQLAGNRSTIEILSGKEVSYNNLLDMHAAWELVSEFPSSAVMIVKHNNPCGGACVDEDNTARSESKKSQRELFEAAKSCDPQSAFGGILSFNRELEESTAEALKNMFVECIIAPSFSEGAIKVLADKPAIRLVRHRGDGAVEGTKELRTALGGVLVQDADPKKPHAFDAECVTKLHPSDGDLAAAKHAWRVVKHMKSNAIALWKDGKTIGLGAGQTSRVDALRIAIDKARMHLGEDALQGSVLASDAFLPFSDTAEIAAKAGIRLIVQPGGSKRDQDSIDVCNAAGVAMLFTRVRHFKH